MADSYQGDVEALLKGNPKALAELARFPDMNPGPVLRTDLEATILMANRAARDLFGDDVTGKSWTEVCPHVAGGPWKQVVGSDELVTIEATSGDRDLAFTHRRDSVSSMIFVYGSDITALKSTQRALDEVARFPDMNPAPVLRMDSSGEVLLANRAARAVFGEDLVGKSWPELCPAVAGRSWDRIRTTDDRVSVEAHIGGRDYVFTHVCDAASSLIFAFGADLTELKQAQEALRQSEKLAALGKLSAGLAHELNNPAAAAQRAAGQLGPAIEELESLAESVGRSQLDSDAFESAKVIRRALVEGASSLREMGPLDRSDREEAIGAWLDGLDVEGSWSLAPRLAALDVDQLRAAVSTLPPEAVTDALAWAASSAAVHELIETVADSTESISDLVGAVKSYSYMDRAPVQEVDVHDGLESTLRILAHKVKRGGGRVERDYDRSLPKITVYAGELNQVWTNLIDNAVDAAGREGVITVRTFRDGERVGVEIGDNGTGIPAEVQSRIFEPFFTTKEVGSGTGLGLDVARRIIVERCKGDISVESKPGDTRFTVRMPINATDG